MCHRRWAAAAVLLLVSLTGRLSAQEPTPWHDPSPHKVQFVTVDKDVKLEVLDWGGSGRSIVLLAGLGGTAHLWDDFAPKLTGEYHVYGITRRGFGASSAPASGYSADRLGDDVLAVLDALNLDRPVLVGHSIAGEELSSIATRHPARVAGLIYLDAAYNYAYFDPELRDLDLNLDLQELKAKLNQYEPDKGDRAQASLFQDLLNNSIPAVEKDLQEAQEQLQRPRLPPLNPPTPSDADRESFRTFRAWQIKVFGGASPEAQLRQYYDATPGGHVGKVRESPTIDQAIIAGEQKYTNIRVPTLAIFAIPHDPGLFAHSDPEVLAKYEARDVAELEPQARAFEAGVPSARVVILPHANHAVFISNEADVLREIRAFLTSLR